MRGPRASDTHCTSPWGSKQSLWMSQHRDSDGKWWKWEYSLKKNSPSQPLHLSIGIQNGSWWLKMLSHSLLPSGKRLHSYWSHGPVEIVDFPNYNMVDLSSSLRKRLPEGHHYPIGPWCWYVYIYMYANIWGILMVKYGIHVTICGIPLGSYGLYCPKIIHQGVSVSLTEGNHTIKWPFLVTIPLNGH